MKLVIRNEHDRIFHFTGDIFNAFRVYWWLWKRYSEDQMKGSDQQRSRKIKFYFWPYVQDFHRKEIRDAVFCQVVSVKLLLDITELRKYIHLQSHFTLLARQTQICRWESFWLFRTHYVPMLACLWLNIHSFSCWWILDFYSGCSKA